MENLQKNWMRIEKEIDLDVNEEKASIIRTTAQEARNLEGEGFTFEKVEYFKLFEALLNENGNSHQGIRTK